MEKTFIKDDVPLAQEQADREDDNTKKEKKRYAEQENRERWDGARN